MPSPTSLAPGFVRITYSGTLFPHHMVIPINSDFAGSPGDPPDLILKDASTIGVELGIAALLDVMMPFFHTTTVFGLAEIHKVDPDTGLDTFWFLWEANKAGVASGAQQAMEQLVFVFKTSIGSLYRMYLMETIIAPNVKNIPPFGAGPETDLADFVTGDSSPIYGRKNAYPFAVISELSKTNDKLRKQQGKA